MENWKPEKILSSLIKINTTNPPGNEIEAAYFLKSLFDEAGIPNEIIEAAPGRANFLAYFGEQRPGSRSLLFLSHLDVVPAGSGWSFDPFSGEISNGFVHGRGAIDCKAFAAAEAAAMLFLSRSRDPLKGKLIFAATADEEKGGRFGVQYLLKKHREKIAADFVINEGAEEPLVMERETLYFIQFGEKGLAWSTLRTRGTAAHGSLPMLGRNAVLEMADRLQKLKNYQPEVVILPEVKHLLNEIARRRQWREEISPENLDDFLETIEDRGFAATLQSMTRLTISPNVIRGGVKTNVVPDLCEVEADIRVLPDQDQPYVLAELRKCLGEDIEVEISTYRPPSFSQTSSPYYQLIERTIREVTTTPERTTVCLPMISPGATDSRFLRAAGFPCYGVAVFSPQFPQELRATLHGPDERLDIESLHYFTEFLIRLARNYLG